MNPEKTTPQKIDIFDTAATYLSYMKGLKEGLIGVEKTRE